MHVKNTHCQYKPYSTEKPKFCDRNKLLPRPQKLVFELPQSLGESIGPTMFWLLKSVYVRLILLVFLQIWIYKRTGMTMMSLMFSIFPHVLYLFYDVIPTFGGAKTLTKKTSRSRKKKRKTSSENKLTQNGIDVPCIDQLREELSCAMCFELFFEPSTTPCGHSFCKICLQSTANKWRNCPNCKQSIR
ncbi:putative aminoacyltransferase, E1 ubiquitin-activating enzyme [Medicago truncatula]|uniref:RING-type E3 ubiquitin transferase n=1 Tax=Medicago truncatula TaxID=3880 RepID=A0A396GVU9_MEDTR|nr:putative aminoacyltransferase, E1 ubiquitin-activating enzyme [Medicago truncatula]